MMKGLDLYTNQKKILECYILKNYVYMAHDLIELFWVLIEIYENINYPKRPEKIH